MANCALSRTSILHSVLVILIHTHGTISAEVTVHILNPNQNRVNVPSEQRVQNTYLNNQEEGSNNQQQQQQYPPVNGEQQAPPGYNNVQHEVHQQMPQIYQVLHQKVTDVQEKNRQSQQKEVSYVIHQEHKPEPYHPPLDIPHLQQGSYHYQQQEEELPQNQQAAYQQQPFLSHQQQQPSHRPQLSETAHIPNHQPVIPVPHIPNRPIDMYHTPTESIKCDIPLKDGSPYYEDHIDCNCYYVCGKNMDAIKMCCPAGLWWDQTANRCLFGREFPLRKQAICLQLTRRKVFSHARMHAKEVLLNSEDATQGSMEVSDDISETENEIDLTLDRYYSHIPDEYIYGHCSVQPNPAHEDLHDFIWGSVDLRQSLKGGPTELRINASGLNTADNNRLHGFHVHEYGDLSNGCDSAGGHYDPFGVVHGGPRDSPQFRHFGDFGNIEEDSQGNIETEIKDYLASLLGPFSVLGRAIVIHEREDDLGRGNTENSLLTGSAGTRLACCTIGLSDGSRWT